MLCPRALGLQTQVVSTIDLRQRYGKFNNLVHTAPVPNLNGGKGTRLLRFRGLHPSDVRDFSVGLPNALSFLNRKMPLSNTMGIVGFFEGPDNLLAESFPTRLPKLRSRRNMIEIPAPTNAIGSTSIVDVVERDEEILLTTVAPVSEKAFGYFLNRIDLSVSSDRAYYRSGQ
ncbi:MAG: hypothetical protein AB8B50_18670 [Pirellulaceae bacterium]